MSNNKNVENITNTSNILTIMDPIQYRGVLYRFRNWESDRRFAEDIICNHRLYVSTAVDNNDNDPQEMNNKINTHIDDYSQVELDEDGVPSSALAYITESMIFSNRMDELMRESDRENIFFCCFSKGYRNEQMWENYGDSNKGICIEFNHLHDNLKKCLVLPIDYKIEDERYIEKARSIIKDEYEPYISFWKVYDYDMKKVSTIAKKEAKLGCEVLVYDTFKYSGENESAWMSLLNDSKELLQICSKNNLAGVVTCQLALATKNKKRIIILN